MYAYELDGFELTVLLAFHYNECQRHIDNDDIWATHWLRAWELSGELPDAPRLTGGMWVM